MKIGILSDTHTKVKKAARAIEILISDGAEFIVHAGDIVELEILELLKNCGLQYVAVYGNNDAHLAQHHTKYNLVQEPYYFKLEDIRFKLMHLPFYMAPDADIIISGHTHKFHSDFKDPTLFINPGEACARNKPVSSWVMLETSEYEFKTTLYTRERLSDEINTQKFKYAR